jgi:NitT/TauT family transport system substrate-binding protein
VTATRRDFLRYASTTALAVAGGSVLAACGSSSNGSKGSKSSATTGTRVAAQKVTAMMPFPLYLNFIADIAGKSGGYMRANGVDLDVQFARSAPQALQELVTGRVAVIRNAPIAIVKAVSQQGAPVVSIGMMNQEILYVLVSTESKPVDDLHSLVGKTVGMATLGGNAEDTFNFVLKEKGIDPSSVKRQAVGNEAASLTFVEQGRVDAIFATRESTASMKSAGLHPHVAEIQGANPLLGTNIVTTRENVTTKRDALVLYLRGLRQAMVDLHDPDKLDGLIPKVRHDWDLPQLDDAKKAKPVIEKISEMWYAAGADNLLRNVPDRWATGVAEFEKFKIAKAGTSPETFYTNDLVDEALSERAG